jgi:hypothetical protein
MLTVERDSQLRHGRCECWARLVGWSLATMRGVLLVFVDCGELCWGYHVQIVVDFVESKLHV